MFSAWKDQPSNLSLQQITFYEILVFTKKQSKPNLAERPNAVLKRPLSGLFEGYLPCTLIEFQLFEYFKGARTHFFYVLFASVEVQSQRSCVVSVEEYVP